MSDDHTKSLHEELLASFMASASTPAEIAAVNEINELRKLVGPRYHGGSVALETTGYIDYSLPVEDAELK